MIIKIKDSSKEKVKQVYPNVKRAAQCQTARIVCTEVKEICKSNERGPSFFTLLWMVCVSTPFTVGGERI